MIRNREQSLEQLSEALRPEQLRKVITQGYSDISLSVMADFMQEYCRMIADSKFSAQTINKLTEACVQNKISSDDLFQITKYSEFNNQNEPYVDSFLNSIDEGVFHETAAKTLAAVNYENCSYMQAIGFVKLGAFYPTKNASLSVTDKTALELEDLGVPLRGCKGFNFCYDITNVKESIADGDAVFVNNKSLAVTVHEMMTLPDWEKFKDSVKAVMGNDMDKLTGGVLTQLRSDYIHENNLISLYEKVKAEHEEFISELKKGSVDNAIGCAYEISIKNDILMFAENESPELSQNQFEALFSSENALHEIYDEWLDCGEYSSYQDIEDCMKVTADKMQISIDRQREQEKSIPKSEPVPEKKQDQAVKPKHKSR